GGIRESGAGAGGTGGVARRTWAGGGAGGCGARGRRIECAGLGSARGAARGVAPGGLWGRAGAGRPEAWGGVGGARARGAPVARGAFPVAGDLVEALAEAGRLDEASEVIGRLGELASEQQHPWGLATWKRSKAVVKLADSHDEPAAAKLAEAATAYRTLGLDSD